MEIDEKYFNRLMRQKYNPEVKHMSNKQILEEVIKLLLDKKNVDDELNRYLYEYENNEEARKYLNTLIGVFELQHQMKKQKEEIESEIRDIDEQILKMEKEIEELNREIRKSED